MSTSKSFLTESDLSLLEESGEVVTFKPKQTIVHQHSPCTNVYWIKKGVIQIEFDRLYGSDVLGYLSDGDMFGEISFIDHAETSASALAFKDTEILKVEREALETLLEQDPHLAARFYRTVAMTLARRIRASNKK